MTNEEVIAAVRKHAVTHYEDGWDVLVECWTNEDILREVETYCKDRHVKVLTPEIAVWACYNAVVIYNEHAKEIRSTAF